MKTLLRIDASIRINGSNTRILTDYFQSQWLSNNPGGKVIHRCLASSPLPHVSDQTIKAFQHSDQQSSGRTLSDTLIDELKRADHLLIGRPLYNLTLPSTLKAYFDHIVRPGLTFEVQQGNYRGLLNGKEGKRPSYQSFKQPVIVYRQVSLIPTIRVEVARKESAVLFVWLTRFA